MNGVLSSDAELRELLLSTRSIAVVGLSDRSGRPSFGVAKYLVENRYEIIPVNPHLKSWQGLPAYPSLALDRAVDMVDVFRRPEFVMETVEDAIASNAKSIWTQLGVVDDAATAMAVDAGIPIVVDRCLAVEYSRLIAGPGRAHK